MSERGESTDEELLFRDLPSAITIRQVLMEESKSSGIEKHVSYHTWRHTFGTMMLTAGADLYTTSKLMGLSDVRTAQIHAKIIDSKKIEAVNLVDNLFGNK